MHEWHHCDCLNLLGGRLLSLWLLSLFLGFSAQADVVRFTAFKQVSHGRPHQPEGEGGCSSDWRTEGIVVNDG